MNAGRLCLVSAIVLINSIHPHTARADGVKFETLHYQEGDLDVVTIDLQKADLRLLWKDENGRRLETLRAAKLFLERTHETPLAITNAGIFTETAPCGIHVENGATLHALNRFATDGNFGMKPNGVFFIDGNGAAISETDAFVKAASTSMKLATQSGPLLLSENRVHHKFNPESINALVRSGVGVKSPTEIALVISRGPIRFYDLALFFRDVLHCPNALYLDGTISRLWAPALGLKDDGGSFMGMLAVVARKSRSIPNVKPKTVNQK